jgi:predicted dehydrogenase
MKEIRWGAIGCGDVMEVKSGPAFRKARGSRLVAVMRRNGALAEDYARRHGVPRWYDNAEALIHDDEVDAVYVGTPPSSHKEYALAAARAGKPVYVEKPMALNHGECVEMIEACRRADVPLFVAYYRRALPRFLKVKELLDGGAIGDLRFVSAVLRHPPSPKDLDRENPPWRVNPAIAGGGHFCDLASHTLDVLDFLVGPIERAAGFAGNQAGLYAAEDVVTAAFTFASGVQGVGAWCFTTALRRDLIEFVGSRGTIQCPTFADDPVRLVTPEGLEEFAFELPEHVPQPLTQIIVDSLLHGAACPSDGESGARTNWVMDQILKSYRAGA